MLDLAPSVEGVHAGELVEWPKPSHVPADAIRQVLLDPELGADPQGLQIRGALVTGSLDLDYAMVPCRLKIIQSRFENAPSFKKASIPDLDLSGSFIPGLQLDLCKIANNLNLDNVRAGKALHAVAARVGGAIFLAGAVLSDPEGIALNLDSAWVGGDVYLENVNTRGMIWARNAHIEGLFSLEDADLNNDGQRDVLLLSDASLIGGAVLSKLKAGGGVDARGIKVGGDLYMTEAVLGNAGETSLDLDDAEIVGDAAFDKLQAAGTMSACRLHVGGSLHLTEAVLGNPGETSLDLDFAEIVGDAAFDKLQAAGTVSAYRLHVGGNLDLTEAILTNPEKRTLAIEHAAISGNAYLDQLQSVGDIAANALHVDGDLGLVEAILSNPEKTSINLNGAVIMGTAYFDQLQSAGEITAKALHVDGDLYLVKAILSNPEKTSSNLCGAVIMGTAYFDQLESTGEITAKGLQVKGDFRLTNAILNNPARVTLDLAQASITKSAILNHIRSKGKIDATELHTGDFEATEAVLVNPGKIVLRLGLTEITGTAFLDRIHADGKIEANWARVGRQLCLREAVLSNPGETSLELEGAYVNGTAFLDGLQSIGEIRAPLATFGDQLILTKAVLSNAQQTVLMLHGAKLSRSVRLDHIETTGTINATLAHFGEDILLEQSVLRNPKMIGLMLGDAEVSGDVRLLHIRVDGEIHAHGVCISGNLDLRESELINPSGTALLLCRGQVAKNVYMGSLRAEGEIHLHNIQIGGSFEVSGAVLTNSMESSALLLYQAEIKGTADLSKVTITGTIDASDTFVGDIDLSDAVLSSSSQTTLNLSRLRVAGGASLENLRSTGSINAPRARIGGTLSLVGAVLASDSQPALDLFAAEITDYLSLHSVRTTGEIYAAYVSTGRDIDLRESILNNPSGFSLNITFAHIAGDANLSGLQAHGEVHAHNIQVENLRLYDATLNGSEETALDLSGASVSDGLFLRKLSATGAINVSGSTIGGLLVLDEARLTNGEGESLNLQASIVERLSLVQAGGIQGPLNLSLTTIRHLDTGEKGPGVELPPLSTAQGWSLGSIHGFLRKDRGAARQWLMTIPLRDEKTRKSVFTSQPWKEVALLYDRIGQPEDARWLRHKAAKQATKAAGIGPKLVRLPYGWLVGYGYYPLQVIPWLALLWTLAFGLALSYAQDFTPTDSKVSTVVINMPPDPPKTVRVTGLTQPPPDAYPQFSAALFAMDTALPAGTTSQTLAWRVTENEWLVVVLAVIKSIAWGLAALLLAGITGILHKD